MNAFYETIQAAVADIEANGFDSAARIDGWITRIEQAARQSMVPDHIVRESMARAMHGIYSKMVDGGGYTQIHKGVSRFTVERLKPKLRAELDRRIMANASLIKLNRERMIEQTKQRLAGWATSIPPGGSKAIDKLDVKANLKKSFQALPFEERRVLIDQSHKLASDINNIIAVDGGAIAAVWKSHFRQVGYNYRPDHKARDGKVYLIRGSWALQKGLIKKGVDGYTDEITKPGEEVFCRCAYHYLYNLQDLPADLLTAKGQTALAAPN